MLKRRTIEFLHAVGALDAFRYFHRKKVLVLTYHDILPRGFPEQNLLFGMSVAAEEFAWQLDYLHTNHNPITFQQFANWFIHGVQLPERAVLITFDDGHTNILHHALPLLKKRNTPAVCFALAGHLGETSLLWFEELYYRIMFSAKRTLTMPGQAPWFFDSTEQRNDACRKIFQYFRTLAECEHKRQLEDIRDQLPLDQGELRYPERFTFLSKMELQLLRENDIEIAAHSFGHPVLTSLTLDSVKSEICEAKQHLEKVLGLPIRSFAYPFGTPILDFGAREQELVEQCGYAFGFTGESGFVRPHSDPFAIPRMAIGQMSPARFAATLTGALFSLKRSFIRQEATLLGKKW